MTTAFVNRIATAVPPHNVHSAFINFAATLLAEGTPRNLFRRMARLSAIDTAIRSSIPAHLKTAPGATKRRFYVPGKFPATARRMELFEQFAPQLARCRTRQLALTDEERRKITHVIVTSCTGLYAPGLDFEVVSHLELIHISRANHDRIHGLLRGHQRAQIGAPHRPLRA